MSTEPTQETTEPAYPSPAYAWYVVGVLMVAYTFSFIDRQILSLMSRDIIAEFDLSTTQYSLLAGFAFALFYTVLGLPIGMAADRFSRRWIIGAGITIWSLMTAACGFAIGFWSLFAARVGVGVGEAALSPSAYSMISDYFPPKTLGLALGTYGMGIYIGSGLAFIIGGTVVGAVSGTDIILPLIGSMTGWKAVFVIVGVPGLLVALLMVTVREPFRRGLKRAGPEGKADDVPFSAVLKHVFERKGAYFSHFMGIAPLSLIGYGSAVYVPLFFYTVHDSSPQVVGLWFGLAVLIMGPLGVVVGGILADQLRLKGYSDCYLRVPAIAALLLIPVNIAFPLVDDPFWAFVILFPGSFIGAMPFGAGPAGLQAITPNQMRAQVSALYLFTVNIIGLGIGPLIIGGMTDLFFTGEGGLRYAMIVVFTAAALWSMAVLFFGFKPFAKCIDEAEGVQIAKQF